MEARMKSRVDELGMSAFGGKHKEKNFSFVKSGGLVGYLSCLTGELTIYFNSRSSVLCDNTSPYRLLRSLLPKGCPRQTCG
jgi:hypothetical protein